MHHSYFEKVLGENQEWLGRIQGVRANASAKSHAELDECEALDDGDLGLQYRLLKERLPNLHVVGGCCGTDHRHVEQMCSTCA